MANGSRRAGDVEFIQLKLYDVKKREVLNLINSFTDFTVFEDLFSPVTRGYVVVVESQNFISNLPLTGEELLIAEFKTPSLDSAKWVFYITGVSAREHSKKKNAYVLELISLTGYQDLNQKVSKAFGGNSSEVAQKIYKESFGRELVDVDGSDNTIKFVSPFWSPLKCLSYTASRALLPNKDISVNPDYMFYETQKGHKLKSLSNLMRSEPVAQLFFDETVARAKLNDGTSTRNVDIEYSMIRDLHFAESADFIKNNLFGVLNHKVFSFDLFTKKFDIKTYNYTNDFYKTQHMGQFPIYSKNAGMLASQAGLFTTRTIANEIFRGIKDNSDDITAKRTALVGQQDMIKLDCKLHGRTDLEVGQIALLWLNNFQTSEEKDLNSVAFDKLYSGRYLIGAIAHRFTISSHEIHLQLIKDSLLTGIESK